MTKESYFNKCSKCKNSITIKTYHYAGGVNDKDTVNLKCSSCGDVEQSVIKNIEQAKITGATVVY